MPTDAFNDPAAEPIGDPWTTCDDLYPCRKSGGYALPSDGGVGNVNFAHGVFYNTGSPAANQYSKGHVVDVTNLPMLIVRQRNSDDKFYRTYWHASRIYVQYYDGAGNYTSVTGGSYISYTMAAGSEFELRVSGTTISVWDDGSQIGSDYTDSNVDSGAYGWGSAYSTDETTGMFSDWEGGDVGGVGGTLPIPRPLSRPFSGPFGGF